MRRREVVDTGRMRELREYNELKTKKPALLQAFFLAVRTGLEPATPGVTGRYSNQLNYRTRRGCKYTLATQISKCLRDAFCESTATAR